MGQVRAFARAFTSPGIANVSIQPVAADVQPAARNIFNFNIF
jgi:hypothetical protein